jgi:CubicO group peptidase (beta-lactamase class C family)
MSIRSLVVLVGVCSFSLGTPTLRAADPKADITGYWDWTLGSIFLKATPVEGKKHLAVTGWHVVNQSMKGRITSGTYDPATGELKYTFEEHWHPDAKGSARYELSEDGKQLKGHAEIAEAKYDAVMTRMPGNTFEERMDSIVANAGIQADTPGAAVLVIEHGKVLFEKGYGLARLKDKKPFTPTTTYELASCSKQFTGTAILLLHERGLLGLEDDARKYLPELPEYDKKRPIRVLDLARHTSGLSEYPWTDPNVKGKDPKFVTNEDYLLELAGNRKKYPLHFKPGEKMEYTNTNYMLLALIVERVSEKSLGTFLKSEIFDPLGMKTAAVLERPNTVIKEPALAYVKEEDKFKALWGPAPFFEGTMMAVGDGNIWMSVRDIRHWDAGWRRGEVLKQETIDKWLVYSTTRDGKNNDYAFGWVLGMNEDKLVSMGHAGSGRTFIGRDLVSDRTIAVLCNRDIAFDWQINHLCTSMPHHIFWRHDTGYFEYTDKDKWTETGPDGATFHFVETRHTDHYVELFDKGRECTVRLTNTECQVKFNDGNFETYYKGKWQNK